MDPAALYEAERRAFVSRLRVLSPAVLSTQVAATPGWTVRDVLAHVVGITADLNAGRFGDGDGDAWTLAQVVSRCECTVDDLAAEWDREAPRFEAGLRLFGYGFGAHYLGDLLQHVGDVETALGRSPVRDDITAIVALDFYLESLRGTLDELGVGALEVRPGDEEWVLGPGELRASVSAPRYEIFRALGGRRTRAEVAALGWSGDAARFIGVMSRYPMPETSLGET